MSIFLSFQQLQDLAVSPGIRDPKLNTAECVIEGHEPDIHATGRELYIGILLGASCLCVVFSCPLLSSFLENYLDMAFKERPQENHEKKKERNAAKALYFLCRVLAVIGSLILIIALGFSSCYLSKGNSPPCIIVIVPSIFAVSLVVSCCRKCCLEGVGNYSFFLSICATVTSYISNWLLIGIMINPTWGLTVTLLVCFSLAAFTYVKYEYLNCENDYKGQTAFLCVCSVFVVIFLVIVVVMAGQSYNGRETADETLKTVLLSVIGTLVSWVFWKSYSSEKKRSNGISAASTDQTRSQQTRQPMTNGENIEMDPLLNS